MAGNGFVGCALIGMHFECGRIEDACQVFDRIPKEDLAVWNAMIKGYVMQGRDKLH